MLWTVFLILCFSILLLPLNFARSFIATFYIPIKYYSIYTLHVSVVRLFSLSVLTFKYPLTSPLAQFPISDSTQSMYVSNRHKSRGRVYVYIYTYRYCLDTDLPKYINKLTMISAFKVVSVVDIRISSTTAS